MPSLIKLFSVVIMLLCSSTAFAVSTDSCFDTTDTVLMLHMNGTDTSTTFTDSDDGAKSVTAVGNAQLDTAQQKFGTASGLFDGTGDKLTVADSADWDWGTGDFTIDFWVRYNVLTSFFLIEFTAATGDVYIFYSDSGKKIEGVINGGSFTTGTNSFMPSTATWYHIAVTRSGSSVYTFVNGSQIGSTGTVTQSIQNATGLEIIDSAESGPLVLNGWIDEYRLVKGTAVWTSNFTAPSTEYVQCAGASEGSNSFAGVSGTLYSY